MPEHFTLEDWVSREREPQEADNHKHWTPADKRQNIVDYSESDNGIAAMDDDEPAQFKTRVLHPVK